MKRIAFLLVALLTVVGIVTSTSPRYERDERAAASIFGRKVFPPYCDGGDLHGSGLCTSFHPPK
jgi:hypothetical protein